MVCMLGECLGMGDVVVMGCVLDGIGCMVG